MCSSWGRPLVHAILYRMFFLHSYKQSSRWKEVFDTNFHMLDCWHKCTKTYHTKLHVQMVFLMMNTWCSLHVQDAKNWIKTFIWKFCVCWFTLHNCITIHGQKTRKKTCILCSLLLIRSLSVKHSLCSVLGWGVLLGELRELRFMKHLREQPCL